jgi:hypothetical protein
MAAKPVNTEPSEQVSPFMRLPAEVRLAIYGLALQDTINITKATTTASQWPCARLEGALALLQTSKSIRVDSRHELLTLVLVHNEDARAIACLRLSENLAAENDDLHLATFWEREKANNLASAVQLLCCAVSDWGFTQREREDNVPWNAPVRNTWCHGLHFQDHQVKLSTG